MDELVEGNMKRKILIIASIIILILLIIGVIIYFRNKKTPSETKISTQQGSINELFSEKMMFPSLSSDEKYFLFYTDNEGIYRRNIDGSQKTKLYSVGQVEKIIWSSNKTKALIKINGAYNIFDIQKRSLSQLSQNIFDANWAETDEKIICHYFDSTINADSFNLFNPPGSEWETIVQLMPGDYEIEKYQNHKVIYFKTITDYRKDLMLYENQEKVLLENSTYVSGVTKDQIVAIDYENKSYQINLKTGDKKDLEIKSGINKSAVSPDGTQSFIALTQENIPDKFYRLTLENSTKEEIKYSFDKILQANNLMITKNNKIIYFLSGDAIYKLSL